MPHSKACFLFSGGAHSHNGPIETQARAVTSPVLYHEVIPIKCPSGKKGASLDTGYDNSNLWMCGVYSGSGLHQCSR